MSLVDSSIRLCTVAADVGARGDHVFRADVDADDVGAVRPYRVQLGVRAAAAGLLADAADQAPLDQPLDELGRGDLGQAGQLADLRPGQRPAREQQLKRRPVVDRAQQPGRTRAVGSWLIAHRTSWIY